jgi:hypothetical protein
MLHAEDGGQGAVWKGQGSRTAHSTINRQVQLKLSLFVLFLSRNYVENGISE